MSLTRLRSLAFGCTLFLLAGLAIPAAIEESGVGDYTWPKQGYTFADGSNVYSYRDRVNWDAYWKCLWLGFGSGREESQWLWLAPKAATSPGQTHSTLVRSNFPLPTNWDISASVQTDAQLATKKVRKQAVPNPAPWEVAWLIGNMTDDGSAGIYFILKTNGVELGVYAQNGYDHAYLFTNTTPKLTLGKSYLYRFVNDGENLTALVDGVPVASAPLTAVPGWVLGNKIGLYTEDAAVRFGPIAVRSYSR